MGLVGQAVAPVLLALAFSAASAQDTRSIVSPNGELKFAVFVSQPKESNLPRIAYSLTYKGRTILETSYLGFDILDQEPLLGENAGLTTSNVTRDTLTARYMQNGSLGRLIVIEAKIADNSVAFRYRIPKSTPVAEKLQIADELTEFVEPIPKAAKAFDIPGIAHVEISEQGADGPYPPLNLVESSVAPNILVTNISQTFETTAPLTTPWRVITVSPRS